MKLTKYGHACLLLEKDGTNLLIDPGAFTKLPNDLPKIDLVIVTHEHFDHFSLDQLKLIASKNPEVQIYATADINPQISDAGLKAQAITGKQTVTVGNLNVELREVDHAVVYGKSPCKSLTVTVGDYLYYPSDTYETTDRQVKLLAMPTSGPWFKIMEGVEFENSINSETVMATHNSLNSEVGDQVADNYLSTNLNDGRKFVHLKDGESLEI